MRPDRFSGLSSRLAGEARPTDDHRPRGRIRRRASAPYARRRRKNHVARVNVKMAMTAIGQMLPITSAIGMLFKKTPLTMIIIYRSGLA